MDTAVKIMITPTLPTMVLESTLDAVTLSVTAAKNLMNMKYVNMMRNKESASVLLTAPVKVVVTSTVVMNLTTSCTRHSMTTTIVSTIASKTSTTTGMTTSMPGGILLQMGI